MTARLQQKRAPQAAEGGDGADQQDKQEKLRLWAELKVMAFTRTVSAVYLVALLSMLTHLQLNLLGRFIYLDSVIKIDAQTNLPVLSPPTEAQDAEAKPTLDTQTERQYLLFSSFLLKEGWRRLVDRVRVAVEESVGNLGLKQPVTFDDLITYVENIRAKVEIEGADSAEAFGRSIGGSGSTPRGSLHRFEQYLLPAAGSDAELQLLRTTTHNPDEQIGVQLAGLLDASHKLLGAPDFAAVLRGALDDCFEILLRSLKTPTFFREELPGPRPAVEELAAGDESQTATTGEERSLSPPLASILPPMTRQVHQIVHSAMQNEYLRAIDGNVGVKGWAAVVYVGWTSDSGEVGPAPGGF